MFSKNTFSFFAELHFFSASEGGRFMPPESGFRPQLKIGKLQTSCVVTSTDLDGSIFSFGKLHRVQLQLMFKDQAEEFAECSIAEYFFEGRVVALYEGSKKVAEGYVVK